MRAMACVMAVTMLVGLGTAHAKEQLARWASPDDATAKYITSIETLWTDANCGPTQPALRAAIAEDFQGTSPNGQRYDRLHALESDGQRDCQTGQIKIHLFGDSLAMAYGNESSLVTNKDGKTWKRCLVWTDTWLQRDGEWQIIAAQDNVVACK
ncbi:MAG TPA: nuclear transport factor 2 family protein [Gammaproteobacteria bacterium]|nr:nuclear transport factor 2 family protein [Gammaproteobacteria bacterium]